MAIMLVVMLIALPARESPKGTDKPVSLAINMSVPLPPVTQLLQHIKDTKPSKFALALAAAAHPKLIWHHYQVKPGDSVSSIFSRAGLTAQDVYAVMHAGKMTAVLRTITPGKTIDIELNDKGRLEKLRYRTSPRRRLVIDRDGDAFQASWKQITPKPLVAYASGSITDAYPSLYLAAREAGLPDRVIMQLANIFQWDLSFTMDLRPGDAFAVMYQENYVHGDKLSVGHILAAELTNRGKRYEAVLYRNAAGNRAYYAPNGTSMRKAFLRDPVHFSYISSGFNPHRMHPIFHRIMPHWGVDFVARKGTPVMASGSGVVVIARRNAASGRYIVIRHGRRYTTKYLHLSRFAHGIRPGTRVKQGQIIGYVGQSGWATAPHLHYEFLVDGVHRNPLTVPLPNAAPVPPGEMARFKQKTLPLLAKLDAIAGKTHYALADRTRLPHRLK